MALTFWDKQPVVQEHEQAPPRVQVTDIPDWIKNLNLPSEPTWQEGEVDAEGQDTKRAGWIPQDYTVGRYSINPLTKKKEMGQISGPGGKTYWNPEVYSDDHAALQKTVDTMLYDLRASGHDMTQKVPTVGMNPAYANMDVDEAKRQGIPEWEIRWGNATPSAGHQIGMGLTAALIGGLAMLPASAAGVGAGAGAGLPGMGALEMAGGFSGVGAGMGGTAAALTGGTLGAGALGAASTLVPEMAVPGLETVAGGSYGAGALGAGMTEAQLLAAGAVDITGASAGAGGVGALAGEVGAGAIGAGAIGAGGVDALVGDAAIASFYGGLSPAQWGMISLGGLGAVSDLIGGYLGAEASSDAMEQYLQAWKDAQWTDERRSQYVSAATNAMTQYGAQQMGARQRAVGDEYAVRGTGGGSYAGSRESEQDKINAMVANSINQSVLETYKPPGTSPSVNAFFQGNQDPWANALTSFGGSVGSILPWWMMNDMMDKKT